MTIEASCFLIAVLISLLGMQLIKKVREKNIWSLIFIFSVIQYIFEVIKILTKNL